MAGRRGMAVAVSVHMTMAVAVSVHVMVTAARRCRAQMVVAAERTVRNERERRHDRQTGRKGLGQRADVTDHTSTDSRCTSEILIAGFRPVQSGHSYKTLKLRVFGGVR